jgi:hypothetical protein
MIASTERVQAKSYHVRRGRASAKAALAGGRNPQLFGSQLRIPVKQPAQPRRVFLSSINLTEFGLGEMLRCSLEIRKVAKREPSMEAAAKRITHFFYDELATSDGARACALVRCYKTHPYGTLPPDLRRFAQRALQSTESPVTGMDSMRCLALLATVGDEPSWNERHLSTGHQAIPLPSAQIVQRAPMISRLIHEFGLALPDVLQPSADVMRRLEGKTYGVFHVEDAAGSPYIPAQAQFVARYGIRSVVGFGGSLPAGELFAVILFTRTVVSAATADRFRTLALDVKGCLVPFAERNVFEAPGSASIVGP